MELSIVVPTYNEKDNVSKLVYEIQCALGENIDYEIIFVDDSNDDTPLLLAALCRQIPQVRYLHRENERGLASAVVAGFKIAAGQFIMVMDADLQHPPSLIPLIYERLHNSDIVIPSRFIAGGSDGGLNPFRKLVSWTARTIGRLSIRRLRDISDCTGGYFGIRHDVIKDIALEPIGWKILMEVLVKGNYSSVHELPYSFVTRSGGESKMNLREQWNYLRHIFRLVINSPEDCRFLLFCAVGILGVFVNLMVLSVLLTYFLLDGTVASVIASSAAMLHNYILNDQITWKGHQHPVVWRRALQLPQFMAVCGVGILITAVSAKTFLSFGLNIYAGQFTGIAAAAFWGYSANNRWTWANPTANKPTKLTVTQEYPREIS